MTRPVKSRRYDRASGKLREVGRETTPAGEIVGGRMELPKSFVTTCTGRTLE
ncbi:MAG: hypothetical protein AB1664_04665 [Thermodesulfobacteriota bacterium]